MHRREAIFVISRLLMIGGDRRAECLCGLLRREDCHVDTLGLWQGDEQNVQAQQAQAVLFPYPFSVKNGCVPALSGLTIHPQDVLDKVAMETPIIAGRGLEAPGHTLLRYETGTQLEARNADLSAEAAICEAMQRMDIALTDAHVLVTGYGLFGRALARKLSALGARVWIAARREEQRALARANGLQAVPLADAGQVLCDMHMVCNTIPAQVLDASALKNMKPGAWLLELASEPYGFDRQTAAGLGLNCAVLPALPARYAPMSAAIALKEAVMQKLSEVQQ